MGGAGDLVVSRRGEIGVGNMRERERLEDVGVDGRITLKWGPGSGMRACAGFIWLEIGTNGGLFD